MNQLRKRILKEKKRYRHYQMADYRRAPFWKGVSGVFDLFGITDFPLGLFKKMNSQRIKRNTISHDLSMVGRDMRLAIKQYEKEIGHSR